MKKLCILAVLAAFVFTLTPSAEASVKSDPGIHQVSAFKTVAHKKHHKKHPKKGHKKHKSGKK